MRKSFQPSSAHGGFPLLHPFQLDNNCIIQGAANLFSCFLTVSFFGILIAKTTGWFLQMALFVFNNFFKLLDYHYRRNLPNTRVNNIWLHKSLLALSVVFLRVSVLAESSFCVGSFLQYDSGGRFPSQCVSNSWLSESSPIKITECSVADSTAVAANDTQQLPRV